MKCPSCGQNEDKVLDSRLSSDGLIIRRRRECLNCHFRYASKEKIEQPNLKIRKRDGSCQPFNLAKIERGVLRSIEKRALSLEMLTKMMHDIEECIIAEGRQCKELSSEKIASIVLEELCRIDQVAYIRFASVCKKFETIEEFLNEINSIIKNTTK